jgi:hypothetical protein
VWFFIAFAVLLVATYAFAPKPPTTPPAGLDTIKVPTAEEGREIPILFGTRIVRSANVVWYGDLRTKAIKSSGGKKG